MDCRLPIRSPQVMHEELQIDHTLYTQLPLVEFSSIAMRLVVSRVERDLLFSKYHENK